ncbi:hypothetical protein HER15_01655 [Tenacibaculum mesophilum]|uniref:Lipoprotein n=1 Tax=Tenacibaculum mesophilum TaxID=104268 RepID=A0AAE9MKZ8_9FLAO|nr:hypothetical protein [Tenacibaculum mesophilum]KAF9657680.1 hypothetical protein HBA12_10630 [Tenacibaculum mesophilum]UTD14256.1 hypothetical protein HER15_01655 [Tenacibaculum mesophilum]GFD92894.1 hypothetical protein KUL154_16270 [Alteromonas sp. KUL154]GFD99623.1 hypothetical protein KUL156_22160 [Alteromonas sp. KUL156]
MRKTTLLLVLSVLVLASCSSVKTTEKALNSGNYEKAISLSIEKLAKNKTKEKNQPHVLMLQEAFRKATDRDLDRISFLEKEQNPENFETIYTLYQRLNNRQERIKPLLPLRILSSGRNAKFKLVNYTDEILAAKENYAGYLYENGVALLNEGYRNKINYRRAFDELRHLDNISPNYRDTRNLIEEAHAKGIDYVHVSVRNRTDQIIPKRLERDLLAIDTYGLNDLWTQYHAKKDRNIRYDFDLELDFTDILISPEQVHEKEVIKERRIKDGFKYLRDNNGNYVKDSLGNKIKVDKFKRIRCNFYKFTQFKSSKVTGVVKYIDNRTNQLLHRFPIQSEFIFEHIYADYDGDRRALDKSFIDLLDETSVEFPSNEQMVYDTGTDLKQKLKHIITRNKFRN